MACAPRKMVDVGKMSSISFQTVCACIALRLHSPRRGENQLRSFFEGCRSLHLIRVPVAHCSVRIYLVPKFGFKSKRFVHSMGMLVYYTVPQQYETPISTVIRNRIAIV